MSIQEQFAATLPFFLDLDNIAVEVDHQPHGGAVERVYVVVAVLPAAESIYETGGRHMSLRLRVVGPATWEPTTRSKITHGGKVYDVVAASTDGLFSFADCERRERVNVGKVQR